MMGFALRPIELNAAETPPIPLRRHEAAIWYRLSSNEGEILSGGDLLLAAWGWDYQWDDPHPHVRTMNRAGVYQTVHRLRRLLNADGGAWVIESIRGEGFRLWRTRRYRAGDEVAAAGFIRQGSSDVERGRLAVINSKQAKLRMVER